MITLHKISETLERHGLIIELDERRQEFKHAFNLEMETTLAIRYFCINKSFIEVLLYLHALLKS